MDIPSIQVEEGHPVPCLAEPLLPAAARCLATAVLDVDVVGRPCGRGGFDRVDGSLRTRCFVPLDGIGVGRLQEEGACTGV